MILSLRNLGIVIDFDSSTVLISAIIWIGIVVFLRRKRNKSVVYLFFFTIFFAYIITILKYTQFPIYLTDVPAYGQTVWTNMNLVPLVGLGYRDLMTSLLNVLLFIPFGFGLPFVTHMRFRSVIIAAAFFSIVLEILQLLSSLVAGRTFRVVDINDVIFNTLGVAIGYVLFVGFIRVLRLVLNKLPIKQNALLWYIYERPQIFGEHVNTSLANGEKDI